MNTRADKHNDQHSRANANQPRPVSPAQKKQEHVQQPKSLKSVPAFAGIEAPVQRIMYDQGTSTLYTSSTWPDVENGDRKKISDALNEDDTKFEDTDVLPLVAERWDIDAYGATIDSAGSAGAIVDGFMSHHALDDITARETATLVDILAQAHRQRLQRKYDGAQLDMRINTLKGGLEEKSDGELIGYINAMDSAKALYLSTFENKIKNKLTEKITPTIAPPLYLYRFTNSDLELTDSTAYNLVNGLTLAPEAVLHPMSYKDPDSDSDVNFNLVDNAEPSGPQKTKVCVLISMIYERALSAVDRPTAKAAIRSLMADLGVDIPLTDIKPNTLNKNLPPNDNLYEDLIPQLHNYLVGEALLYDLEKYSEQVLKKSYTRIVSTNCAWNNLPANIPPGVTLAQGETFVFMIQGHATTVKMKLAVQGEMGAAHPTVLVRANVFDVVNETTSNYNHNPFDSNVESIWRKN